MEKENNNNPPAPLKGGEHKAEEKSARIVRMVFMKPEDFNVIVNFVSGLNVPFLMAKEALEVKGAIERAKFMDIKEETTP